MPEDERTPWEGSSPIAGGKAPLWPSTGTSQFSHSHTGVEMLLHYTNTPFSKVMHASF